GASPRRHRPQGRKRRDRGRAGLTTCRAEGQGWGADNGDFVDDLGAAFRCRTSGNGNVPTPPANGYRGTKSCALNQASAIIRACLSFHITTEGEKPWSIRRSELYPR